MKFKLLSSHYIHGGLRPAGTIVDLDCVKKDGKYEGKELPSKRNMEEYKGSDPAVSKVKEGKEPVKLPG